MRRLLLIPAIFAVPLMLPELQLASDVSSGAGLRLIAFASNRGFDGDHVWTAAGDGQSLHQVITRYSFSPTWSPDRRRIAFVGPGVRGRTDIFVARANGTGLRNVTRSGWLDEGNPAWTPRGEKIAFTGGGIWRDIWVIGVNGRGLVRLTRTPRCAEGSPAWSPDGRRIAFTRCAQGQPWIYVMRSDGAGKRRLQIRGEDPEWSPDGKRLAFSRDGQLRVAALDGSGGRALTGDLYPQSRVAWSPDGRTIAFVRSVERDPRETVEQIFLIGTDGSGERPLFSGPPYVSDSSPDW